MDWKRTRRVAVLATATATIVIGATSQAANATPRPPHLPQNFRGQGEWIVRDLGITVPFSWRGNDGNSRMIAGGPDYPIWFTNVIWHNSLYTLTYKWPGVTDEPTCLKVPGFFNLHILNQLFKGARFVGREVLQGHPNRRVNHWRVGVVFPPGPPGNHGRIGLALGDIYVDQGNRSTFWQVLQFGVQNLLDPQLDEWLRMDTFRHKPGRVGLPGRCPPPG
jgi:hypothetical protein